MFRNYQEPLLEACQVLAEQEHLAVTIGSVAKGAAISGLGAFIGGMLGGPVGIAVGGALASITTGMVTRGSYRSVSDILKNDLSPSQRQRLSASLSKVVNNVNGEDVVAVVSLIATHSSVKDAVISTIGSFLSKELNMSMITNGY